MIILYKYLKTEITQLDRFNHVDRVLTHDEITEMFTSKEFRQFITFEQVNFYIDIDYDDIVELLPEDYLDIENVTSIVKILDEIEQLCKY